MDILLNPWQAAENPKERFEEKDLDNDAHDSADLPCEVCMVELKKNLID